MGGTVFAEGQPGVRGGDLHVGTGVGDALSDLVVHAAGGEGGEGADKGDFASEGEAGADTDHIGFGNTGLEKAVGVLFDESTEFERSDEVGAQSHDIGVGTSQLGHGIAESGTGVFLSCNGIGSHVSFC